MMNNMMSNFNQMGMNNPMMAMNNTMMGMNNQQNQMNGMMMDETSQNIRNIIQPYENKIRELEEIIKQKDFEISVLKQKLNNNNSIINNMNPMMINMNMNPFNLMMGNMNQQMENKGPKIHLTIISENKKEDIECFRDDKASILYEKCNISKKHLAFNYKAIDRDSTIKENGIIDKSLIYAKNNVITILFKNRNGEISTVALSEDCPIKIALIHYYMKLGRINYNMKDFNFSYYGKQLTILDKIPIKEIFKGSVNPIVDVQQL